MSGFHGGVQVLVKEIYNNAHLARCYGHQRNLILLEATSKNTQVRISLSSLSEISRIFSDLTNECLLYEVFVTEEFQQQDGILKAELLQPSTKIKTKLFNVAMN